MGQRRWFKTRDKVKFKIYCLQDPVLSPILKHEGVDLNGHEMMMINMESKQGINNWKLLIATFGIFLLMLWRCRIKSNITLFLFILFKMWEIEFKTVNN